MARTHRTPEWPFVYFRNVETYVKHGYEAWIKHDALARRLGKKPWYVQGEEALREDWGRLQRDGHYQEAKLNQNFKRFAKKKVRRKNREFCRMVLRQEDHDAIALPDEHDGDGFIWDFL